MGYYGRFRRPDFDRASPNGGDSASSAKRGRKPTSHPTSASDSQCVLARHGRRRRYARHPQHRPYRFRAQLGDGTNWMATIARDDYVRLALPSFAPRFREVNMAARSRAIKSGIVLAEHFNRHSFVRLSLCCDWLSRTSLTSCTCVWRFHKNRSWILVSCTNGSRNLQPRDSAGVTLNPHVAFLTYRTLGVGNFTQEEVTVKNKATRACIYSFSDTGCSASLNGR